MRPLVSRIRQCYLAALKAAEGAYRWAPGAAGFTTATIALDLKGTFAAVLRAPLSDDEVLAELWASLGKGAGEMDALDYWVVLADQLERHGIPRPEIFERAIAIIESGEDVAMLKELEAEPKTHRQAAQGHGEAAGAAARPAAGEKTSAGEEPAAAPVRARRGADLADRWRQLDQPICSRGSALEARRLHAGRLGLRDRHRSRPPLPRAGVLRGAGAEMAAAGAPDARACGALPARAPPLRHVQ